MATKKAPTQAEAVEQVKEVSTSLGNPNDKPDMVDPIIYRDDYKTENITSGYDPKKLANANMNLSKYGDDSSLNNSSNPDTVGGMSGKYTGQGTSNTFVNYDANMTLDKLDPAYKYGQDAEMQNSREANYIAKRNDSIASALYNAGKKSMEDVAEFLNQQEGFRNSYEESRQNTIMSIWKRIGDIEENNDKDRTELEVKEMEAEKKAEPKGQNVNVNTFLQGSTTELFGKMITGADTAPYDHNSTEWLQAEARLKQYERVNALSVDQLASNIKSGSILAGGQAMRDLQAYNPEKYQMLQEYQKKQEALDQINMIASGNFTDGNTNLQDQTGNSINNYLNETVANAGLDANARMDLDTALSKNQGIINYAEKMSYYQAQINQLDQTIGNLAQDARRQLSKSMGENVPEYMIQNYINNRSKKLYNQRNNLKNQYDYYKGVYEAQVEQEATAWERDYKNRQLQLQQDKADWDKAYNLAKLGWEKEKYQSDMDYKNDQLNYNYYQANSKNPVSSTQLQGGMNTYIESIQEKIQNNGKIRQGRCGEPVNDYLKSIGINYKYDDKKSTKLNSRNSGTPTIGSIAIWDKTGTTDGDKYGHVAIVTDINNKNGTITVLESNKNTGLRYHTYKQGNVYGYYDPSVGSKSSTTTKSSTKETKTTPTNEELYTKLERGGITYTKLLEGWNGDESGDDIENYVGDKYMEQHPLMFMSDLGDYIDKLAKMYDMGGATKEEREEQSLAAKILAEEKVMESLKNNKNIKNNSKIKMVYDYWKDNFTSKDSLIDFLSVVLDKQYKSKDTLNNDLSELKSWWDVGDWGRRGGSLNKLRENIK